MLLKLTVAYTGGGFHGWARQPGSRTVEGSLAEALGRLYRGVGRISVAGRTDAGVHALANVVSVEVSGGPPPSRAASALNALLPSDIAVTAAQEAPRGFHARSWARSRSYRYRIWRAPLRSPFEAQRALWRPRPLEVERLRDCAARIVGPHDFRAFTPTRTQHRVFARSVIDARWVERGEALEFEITADSFLYQMVRTLVGTMLTFEPDALEALLVGAHRSQAGETAPAHGLTLVSVAYDGPQTAAEPDERPRSG